MDFRGIVRDPIQLQTSHAVDLINGCVRINALLETTSIWHWHHSAQNSLIKDVKANILGFVEPIIEIHGCREQSKPVDMHPHKAQCTFEVVAEPPQNPDECPFH